MGQTTIKNKQVEETLKLFGVNRQAIINGGFTVNQRAYVSGATLSAGSYGHDRWKAGASGGDYSFTQLASPTQITIASGKSLIQIIEDKNVIGTTYTLSWVGTAQARFGIDSATPSGTYATSPITISTQTVGTVMSVEFNNGTLGQVQLNVGTSSLPFCCDTYDVELQKCQRYCFAITSGAIYTNVAYGIQQTTTTGVFIMIPFVEMRSAPTLTATASDWQVTDQTGGAVCTSLSMVASNSTKERPAIQANWSAWGSSGKILFLTSNNATGKRIVLSSEL